MRAVRIGIGVAALTFAACGGSEVERFDDRCVPTSAVCSRDKTAIVVRDASITPKSSADAAADDAGAASAAEQPVDAADERGDAGVSPPSDAGSESARGSTFFSAYKDTSINMNWSTYVASTRVGGSTAALADDLKAQGGKAITLAFATGECARENWGGVDGATMASVNVPLLEAAGIDFVLSTGGATGSFSCSSDADFESFLARWASPHLVGVDFDIEAGQSKTTIEMLIARIVSAHARHPALRFSLTLATLANNAGASAATSLGASAPSSLNVHGEQAMAAVLSKLGWDGREASWPGHLTVNLMTMDYGSASADVCVVRSGSCDMGQSAVQAAYNLHDHHHVPYERIELTPMIGGNDVRDEVFTLADVDVVASFALARGLAGVHHWSYDRDVDCARGAASPTCNSLGDAGAYGFLKRFAARGLR